jgi:hypothetical protein
MICAGCRKDCSKAYGLHSNRPYHFACFPMPQPKPKGHDLPSQFSTPRSTQQAQDAEWLKDGGWSGKR